MTDTPDTELIEHVAKAIEKVAYIVWHDVTHDGAREIARVALLAARERDNETGTFEAGYQAAIADLRWLAGARNQYTHEEVQRQVATALQLADILDGANGAAGWLPSWLWVAWLKESRYGAPDIPAD